jgi:hypothetical protein
VPSVTCATSFTSQNEARAPIRAATSCNVSSSAVVAASRARTATAFVSRNKARSSSGDLANGRYKR